MEQYLFSHAVAEVLIMGHKDQPTRVPLQACLKALNGLHVQVCCWLILQPKSWLKAPLQGYLRQSLGCPCECPRGLHRQGHVYPQMIFPLLRDPSQVQEPYENKQMRLCIGNSGYANPHSLSA